MIKEYLDIQNKYSVFNKKFLWKAIFLYSYICISQNENKARIVAIPVTYWPSDWQTETTSNVNIFNLEIFLITKSKFYNLYFEWYKGNKGNKKTLVSRDSEWIVNLCVNLWLRDKRVYRGPSPLKMDLRESRGIKETGLITGCTVTARPLNIVDMKFVSVVSISQFLTLQPMHAHFTGPKQLWEVGKSQ